MTCDCTKVVIDGRGRAFLWAEPWSGHKQKAPLLHIEETTFKQNVITLALHYMTLHMVQYQSVRPGKHRSSRTGGNEQMEQHRVSPMPHRGKLRHGLSQWIANDDLLLLPIPGDVCTYQSPARGDEKLLHGPSRPHTWWRHHLSQRWQPDPLFLNTIESHPLEGGTAVNEKEEDRAEWAMP